MIRHLDSFDHYTALLSKYNVVVGSPAVSAGNGRRGTASFRFPGGSGTGYVKKAFDSQATWFVNFGFRAASFATALTLVGLADQATLHVDLRVNTSGQLIVTRNGTALGTSAFALTANAYAFIEFKATIHDTTGAFEVRVNGVTVLSGSSVDTRNGANSTADTIYVGHYVAAVSAPIYDIDDLSVCDATGSVNNTFLGDRKVVALLPTGAGNANVWTPNTGTAANSYQLLDESPPNDDTDYISSATVGEVTTVALADLTNASGAIAGVQVSLYARKDDAGARTIALVTRSGVTDFDGANISLGDSYQFHSQIRETDPNTSAAWTIAGIAAVQAGSKIIS